MLEEEEVVDRALRPEVMLAQAAVDVEAMIVDIPAMMGVRTLVAAVAVAVTIMDQ
jgi:hypothetical protein